VVCDPIGVSDGQEDMGPDGVGAVGAVRGGVRVVAEVAGVFALGTADRLYQFDQLSRWLEREGLAVGELTDELAERFAAARRAAGVVMWAAAHSALLPLGYLRELGVAPAPAPAVAKGPRRLSRRVRLRSCLPITGAICGSSALRQGGHHPQISTRHRPPSGRSDISEVVP